jgi:flagellin
MATTVNTNVGAMVALQNLNLTSKQLEQVQERINTGLKVASAKDNGGVFAIAQNMRSEVGGLNAVQQSLDRAMSVVDVGISAGTAVSDILIEMKEKAVSASDVSLDSASRNALAEDFNALRDQIGTIIANAKFNGINLTDGTLTLGVRALANSDGSAYITVASEDLSLSGAIMTLTTTSSIGTMTTASAAIATVEASLQNVNESLARLGTGSRKLEIHKTFVSKLSDSLRGGIGNLVDADLAQESARLQSLQVKQQLGVQALAIANSAPQMLLGLFR